MESGGALSPFAPKGTRQLHRCQIRTDISGFWVATSGALTNYTSLCKLTLGGERPTSAGRRPLLSISLHHQRSNCCEAFPALVLRDLLQCHFAGFICALPIEDAEVTILTFMKRYAGFD